MERQILHVDVNNAFLSWSAVDMLKNGCKVDIREIPAVIGGDESRRAGIVLAKSMKAKACGISTGETLYQARLKCPNLQIFPPLKYGKYKEYSKMLYNLLSEYTNIIEQFSIDECFLDMTDFLMGDTLLNKAIEINKRAREELGFTVNIGVANNKLLAKMASDFTKPDRVHTLFKDEISTKMWNLPIKDLFMLGRKSVPKLNNLKIKTIGDLAHFDKEKIIKIFGKHGKMMWEYANGIDDSEVVYQRELPKGIGNSVTMPSDVRDEEKLNEVLLALCEQVAMRLRAYNMLAKTVNVQLKNNEFKEYSHQGKLDFATASTKEIYSRAKALLKDMYKNGEPIRLIGVRLDNLQDEEERQISLFDNKGSEKQKQLDKIVDSINQKYGKNSVTRAGKLNIERIVKLKEE